MLPTWATVAIALGGSALGAFSGALAAYLTLRATHVSLRHHEAEAWRTRLLEAGQRYSADYTDVYEKYLAADKAADDDRNRLVERALEAQQALAFDSLKLTLLFGPGSPADLHSSAANEALEELIRDTGSLGASSDDRARGDVFVRGLRLQRKVADEMAAFIQAVHDATAPHDRRRQRRLRRRTARRS